MAAISLNKDPDKAVRVSHLLSCRKVVSMWVTAEDGTRVVLRLNETETDYLRTLLKHGIGPKKRRRVAKKP